MARRATCRPDAFAATLSGMLAETADAVGERLEGAVRASTRLARRKVAARARGAVGDASGDPSWRQGLPLDAGERYPAGFSYRVTRGRRGASGEVGNRDMPGLVHLLEKGHARVGGGRVQAFEHVAPAAEEAFEDFERRVSQAVDEGLRA